jgi:hypothetical protein
MALALSFPQLDSSASISDHVDAYLARPYFSGLCTFNNRTVAKRAGAKWNGDIKKWCAPNENVLRELLQSGVWEPDCDIAAVQMNAILSMREEAARREAHAKECAERKRTGPSDAQIEQKKVTDLGIKTSTVEELYELKQWGVTDAQLELSIKDERLGPRGSLSAATRLLLGLEGGYMTPGAIGKNDLRRKRRELGEAVKSKKLPTLTPFGKTSFRTPQRNDDAVVLIKEWVSKPLAVYDEHDIDNLNRPYTGPVAYRTSKCDICGGDSDEQFPCECVETKMAMERWGMV